MSDLPRRGELWWCELADIGRRPVVVLSRDVAMLLAGVWLVRRPHTAYALDDRI